MRVPVTVEVDTPVVNITLPSSLPLMCDGPEAARLFGISTGTLANLRKHHRDFPVKRVGESVRYLVPDLYAWFRDYPEATIPTE